MAKLPAGEDVEYLILPEPTSPLDRLLEGKFGLSVQSDLRALVGVVPEAKAHLRAVESLLRIRGERAWLMVPYGVRVR
jgi:hypothetical protein